MRKAIDMVNLEMASTHFFIVHLMWRVEVLFFSGGIIREKAVEEILLGSMMELS